MTTLGPSATLSLRLDAEDLAKVRLSPTWGPLSESLFSLRLLRRRQPNPLVAGWTHAVRSQLEGWIAPLLVLTPTSPLIDLHTVAGESPDMEPALASLAKAPASRLSAELQPLHSFAGDCLPWVRVWLRALTRGEPRARRKLSELLERYYDLAVAPYWRTIRSFLAAEQAHRGRIMALGGVEQLLGTLHPLIRWRPPVLEVQSAHGPRRAQSPGVQGARSLILVPSVFCLDGPHVLTDPGDHTSGHVLVYPALRQLDDAAALWIRDAAPDPVALARLLGNTRASALHAIANPCTTTALAHRLQVSLATASHHVSVLRDAHLIVSSRNGTAVDHRLTQLGELLLQNGSTA
jgi:DNA-binding transcriptional ArsR family regulator